MFWSKTSSLRLFGPPPLLEGEDAAAYDEVVARVFSAVRPTDFIEEIWARDLADVSWSLLRLRRIQAAFLSDQVSDIASDTADTKATSLAAEGAELMEGSEKEEMDRLLNDDSLTWEELVAQNPHANEKFQELWASARSNLDMDAIQAKVMLREFDKIEQIEKVKFWQNEAKLSNVFKCCCSIEPRSDSARLKFRSRSLVKYGTFDHQRRVPSRRPKKPTSTTVKSVEV